MKFRVLAGIMGCLVLLVGLTACEKSPRENVILHAGTTTLVSGGRVVVTLLGTERIYQEASGDTLQTAHLRVRCEGEIHELSVQKGPWAEVPCGIRLRVNEVFQQTLPAAVLDIAWE